MKLQLLSILLTISITYFAQNPQSVQKVQDNLVFIENSGQVKDQFGNSRPDILYYGKSEVMNFFIRKNGMSYQLSRVESWKEDDDEFRQSFNEPISKCKQSPQTIGTYRVDAEWINANAVYKTVIGKALDGYNNYYNIPNNENPILFSEQYETVTLKNVWDGIDLHYYSSNGLLETDYLVSPGADYRNIQIQFKGAELSIDNIGNLILKTPFGEIHEGSLKVYQNNVMIEALWKISKDNIVYFEIPNYNPNLALRIDPVTRIWGTYYGGVNDEGGRSCAVDTFGNIYLAGNTNSDATIASGGHQNIYGADAFGDAYLVKFNSSGVRMWGTYYGGEGEEWGRYCSIDASGNVYLAGKTNSYNSIVADGHQNTFGGGNSDAFLTKFNSLGVRLWGTYYGGEGDEYGYSCPVDNEGNVYLAGWTTTITDSLAIASGGHQNTSGGTSDAFLAKFNSFGVRLWGTFYGGLGSDKGWPSSVDSSGNVYLGGNTRSNSNDPIIASNGHQDLFGGGGSDAFLIKFNSSGVRQWGTYYGGEGDEYGLSCSIDISGNVYLAGETTSTSAIASNGHQNTIGSIVDRDAFLVKFNSSGERYWGTFYGGEKEDRGFSCSVNNSGNVYLAGWTKSTTSIASGGYQNIINDTLDAFLVCFNNSGIRQWGTYYGGDREDSGISCLVDTYENVYLTGYTGSTDAIASDGHQNTFGGNSDAFLVKFGQIVSTEVISKIDSKISIFPNPSSGQFMVFVEPFSESNYIIFDQLGRIVKTGLLNGPKTNLNLDLESGIYFLKVNDFVTKLQVIN